MAPGTAVHTGAAPLWCFVFNGKIEYSVTVDRGTIHLYVMDTDQEIVLRTQTSSWHGYGATGRRRPRSPQRAPRRRHDAAGSWSGAELS